jgi:hypothetical protein
LQLLRDRQNPLFTPQTPPVYRAGTAFLPHLRIETAKCGGSCGKSTGLDKKS